MSVKTGKLNVLGVLNVATTIFSDVGDKLTATFNGPSFSSDSYVRSHLTISGSFIAEFPGTDYPNDFSSIGKAWPYADAKEIKTFNVIATEPNSSYHCIVPASGYRTQSETLLVKADTPVLLELGSLYVPIVRFMINGVENELGTVINCFSNSAIITPLQDGTTIKFTAISIFTG